VYFFEREIFKTHLRTVTPELITTCQQQPFRYPNFSIYNIKLPWTTIICQQHAQRPQIRKCGHCTQVWMNIQKKINSLYIFEMIFFHGFLKYNSNSSSCLATNSFSQDEKKYVKSQFLKASAFYIQIKIYCKLVKWLACKSALSTPDIFTHNIAKKCDKKIILSHGCLTAKASSLQKINQVMVLRAYLKAFRKGCINLRAD